MSGSSPHAPDDARISTTAALAALGGHAAALLVALLVSERSQNIIVAPGAVSVTLVSSAPGGAPTSSAATPSPASAASRPAPPTPSPTASGESLDRLLEPDAATSASTPAASTPSPPRGGRPTAGGSPNASGSSQAAQGLGQGEGAEGIDLYAAASLPNVGARPASPPDGDLWKKVAPCWRQAAPRQATLMVEIGADGRLTGMPRAVRKISAPADPQLLLAERAAARAVQACAPYDGLNARTWRVAFP